MSNHNKEKYTGIILAGGRSSRFGEDKGLYELHGKKLIEYAIDTLKPLCQEIIISTNNPEAYSFTGLKTLIDIHQGCGPLGGIHAGLTYSATDANVFISCDMPWLPTELLKKLIDNSTYYQMAVPVHKKFIETMSGYIHLNCLAEIEKSIKERRYKVLEAIKPLKVLYLNVENYDFYNEKIFININSKDDIIE